MYVDVNVGPGRTGRIGLYAHDNPEELAKIYDENLELAKCLREKGLNVPDPSQQEPKIDLSGLKESKDDIMPLLQECGWQK